MNGASSHRDLPAGRDQQQADFNRLLHRFAELAWSSSALEQRERASLQQPLMNLYLALNPGATFSCEDDFDTVLRSSRHQ